MLILVMTKPKQPLAYDDEPAGRSSWKSLYKTLISSVLPSYLSRAIPLELIRDLDRLLCTHVPPLLTCVKSTRVFPHLLACVCWCISYTFFRKICWL